MKIEKILIIRFRRVGDAVLSSTLCSSLKKTFPNAEIHYVLNQAIAPLFEHHPDIDKLICFTEKEKKSFFTYIWKVFRLMRKEKYDIIIDTRATLNTLYFSFFSPFTKFRIGRQKKYNKIVHNYLFDTAGGAGDEIDRTLLLLQPLEKITEVQYVRDFKLYVTEEEKLAFKEYMQQQGIDFSKKIILCTPVTRLAKKQWNTAYMQEVLYKIIDKYDAQIIFNYAPNEQDLVADLHNKMKGHKNIFTNINAKSLRDLLALTAQCDFFFGNEGGPRHISQAFNTPSFALFSPRVSKEKWLVNKSERFQALAPQDIKTQQELDLLSVEEQYNTMSVSEVWKRLEPMLDKYLQT